MTGEKTKENGDSPALILADEATFRRLQSALAACFFDVPTLCRLLGMNEMSDLGRVDWNARASTLGNPLRTWVDFLVRGEVILQKDLVAAVGDESLSVLKALGLWRASSRDFSRCFCPFWLYPADGFLVVSDRRDDPDGDVHAPAEDVVFPAIYGGTLRFIELLPPIRTGDALDLCGGTGIAALRLSRTATQAVTSDLTARSAHFAAFNARLNGVELESLCGDLYQPVGGRQFDLITAHPPFVPASGPNMVYRDAGETGEDVTRGVVAGLPEHLRPGGRCVVLCAVRDTHQQGIETRAREWLGDAAGDFDVVFALEKVLTVDEVVDSLRKRGSSMDDEVARRLRERLLAADTKRFVYGALLLERWPEGCELKPARVRMVPKTRIDDFDRLRRIRRARNRPGFSTTLADSKPRLAPGLELRARHTVRDGELVPAEFVFSVEGPLPTALRTDGFVVPLIGRLTGAFTLREVFDHAFAHNELPVGFTLEAYVNLVATMIEEGLLEVELPA